MILYVNCYCGMLGDSPAARHVLVVGKDGLLEFSPVHLETDP